jgi:hypothetical protein
MMLRTSGLLLARGAGRDLYCRPGGEERRPGAFWCIRWRVGGREFQPGQKTAVLGIREHEPAA